MTKPPPSPPRPRLRRLSEEEIELWLTVAAGVARRAGSRLPDRLAIPSKPSPSPATPAAPAVAVPNAAPPKTPPPLVPLERRLKQKLSRGQMSADAAIDLHGLRQHEAHDALRAFLHRAQRDGARVVIVVTGKGGRMTGDFEETGVLRRAVPIWLHLPDLRSLVVGFEEAARHHGGSGALYVRLRRLRDRAAGEW
ncbi:MAG: Smr/MutS family protein [Beijerinckiaceae bacterium]